MRQYYSSLHTHSVFCDGKEDIDTICRRAYEKGLFAIGFSSHAPIGKAGLETDWHMKDGRLGEYADAVNAAKKRWEGKIAVYLGLEVDYIRGLRSPMDNDILDIHTDYLISSVHYLLPPQGSMFTVDGPDDELEKGIREGFGGNCSPAEAGMAMMNAYWDAFIEMASVGGFDIVAHLDLGKKSMSNPAMQGFDINGSDYKQGAEKAAKAIAAGGFIVEVNTGGLNRGYFNETCPSLPILRLLRQYDIPVMISADAHRADDLDGHYPQARQFLLEAGYTSHFLFQGRNNGKPVWKEQPL
jgi:histidinol-phosphatase (PHP family)